MYRDVMAAVCNGIRSADAGLVHQRTMPSRQIRAIIKHVRAAEQRKRQGKLPGFDEVGAA